MASRILVALRVPASPARAFEAFTREIGQWWQPNQLFQFSYHGSGRVALEPRLGGRFVEVADDGNDFEIGRVTVWEPPHRLALTWRQDTFGPGQETRVEVRFDAVSASETRVSVEHVGWDTVPSEHVARHGFPAGIFLQRHGEWWQALLAALGARLQAELGTGSTS